MKNRILFYGHTEGDFACFSNFYPAEFYCKGHRWSNSEQCFMSFKDDSPEFQKKIKRASNPFEAKALGRQAAIKDLEKWDSEKFIIMFLVLTEKFSQNEDLAKILLSTEDLPIHEDCHDPWWGGGPNFPSGKDMLGKVLMKVRSCLRKRNDQIANFCF